MDARVREHDEGEGSSLTFLLSSVILADQIV
jgi:hypothetical protein